ncbi:MAG: PQQ-dependent sugar dehydrogenase [Pseudomonadales bacterium]|nr:PQQ-dependent sugar dehydrogenase [Pseudomonadales bacterium]
MNRLSKWAAYATGVITLIILVLYIGVRFYVGAINFPLGGEPIDPKLLGQRITVPAGFSIGIYADVENARVIRFSRGGDLLVATPNLNKVELLGRDENNDGKADSQSLLIDGLNGPNGLDFFQDWLYIAETDAIGRIKFNHDAGRTEGEYERIVTGLPGGENHWKKTLRFGPDEMMYVTMGSSCNVCIEEDERRATMVRYTPDGKNEEIFARGLRNSAGFDWSPKDGSIYATDNGRDMLGDNFPPCELNRVEQGKHYGWPFANGNKVADPDFGDGNEAEIASSIAPVFDFNPHNAPLGIAFIHGDSLPNDYHQAAIVALHGSWNRSQKDGYKVVSLHWDDTGRIEERDFVSGFLLNDTVVGRPAEVAEGPDGAIYISDDYASVIYRVAYGEAQKLQLAVPMNPYNSVDTLSSLGEEQQLILASEGAELYQAYQCVACHADNGSSLKKLENLGERYNLETIAEYIRRPNSPMPIYPLTEAQRRSLGVYLIERYPGQ